MPENRRRLPWMKLRRAFELALLTISIIAGLAVVGSCATSGWSSGAGTTAVNLIGGMLFAIVLVGAVFLFITMSRDVRLLRQKYVDAETASRQLAAGGGRQEPGSTQNAEL